MRQTGDELVYYSINADGPADKFKFGIVRILEDKMMEVEVAQLLASDTASQLQALVSVLRFFRDLPLKHG